MLPAAKCIPVVQALQKIRDRKLAVIGEGKTSGCGGVKGGHYGAGVPRDRLLPAPESFRQRLSIVGVFYLLGGAPPQEGGLRFGDLNALRIPAQEGAPADEDALGRRQPVQRAVDLLRCLVAHSCSLRIVCEAAPIGKAAGVVGGDQLGVGAQVDDLLGVLAGGRGVFTGNHAKRGLLRFRGCIVVDEGLEEALILPAGGRLIFPTCLYTPADDLLFLDRKAFFIQCDQAALGHIRCDCSLFHIAGDGGELGVAVG